MPPQRAGRGHALSGRAGDQAAQTALFGPRTYWKLFASPTPNVYVEALTSHCDGVGSWGLWGG